ncbi:LOW QUALITY PROTEIN: hypothetical protein ACHAWF_010340 [Thalassiosira exigua]
MEIVEGLYLPPLPFIEGESQSRPHSQEYHLPGDVCDTILKAPQTMAARVRADTIDAFVSLVECKGPELQHLIQNLFDSVYQGIVPEEVRMFFPDTYLFCLYKNPEDQTKMHPTERRSWTSLKKNTRNWLHSVGSYSDGNSIYFKWLMETDNSFGGFELRVPSVGTSRGLSYGSDRLGGGQAPPGTSGGVACEQQAWR